MSEPTTPRADPEPAGGTVADVERRASPRHHCHLVVPCGTVNDWAESVLWPAVVCDISAGGVGLVLGRACWPGSVLQLKLPGAPGRPLVMLAVVRHCTPQDDGRWRVGCAFARPLTDDELRDVL